MIKKLTEFLECQKVYEAEKVEKLLKYMDEILDWNTKVNLTNIVDKNDFIEKHYLDSLILGNEEVFLNSKSIIDVGTGGGFPGIPLAICYEDKEYTLLDSLNKRLKIIDQLTGQLGINNVTTCHGRAEELGQKKEYRESFDLCVSRAVANLTSLSELCIPFVNVGGYFIAYKGPGVYEELKAAEKAIKVLGGEVVEIKDAAYGKGDEHKLLVIKKIKKSPKKYPRKPGEPVRNPIV